MIVLGSSHRRCVRKMSTSQTPQIGKWNIHKSFCTTQRWLLMDPLGSINCMNNKRYKWRPEILTRLKQDATEQPMHMMMPHGTKLRLIKKIKKKITCVCGVRTAATPTGLAHNSITSASVASAQASTEPPWCVDLLQLRRSNVSSTTAFRLF